MTRRDPWVNLLRTTIACFAAAVGGADAITVLPFDAAIGLPDDFARRIARNTHAVLHDESSLGRVVDAAGGSWYVESLTDALAERGVGAVHRARARRRGARRARRRHDRRGGSPRAATRAPTRSRTARAPLTGVTEFAFPDEKPVTRPAAPAAPSGGPLAPVRYAQDFEALRDRCDAVDPRPAVFLAALGTAAAAQRPRSRSRRTCSRRPGCASSSAPANRTRSSRRSSTAARPSPACARRTGSTPSSSRPRRRRCKAAGAKYLWLAGSPGTDEHSDRSAGVDGYVHAGCDALDVLHHDARPPGGAGMTDSRLRFRRARLVASRPAPRDADGVRRGRRRRASPSRRSTPRPTWTGWTSSRPTRASRRSCAARTRRCTSTSRGPSASTRDSPPRRTRTRSTGATSRWGRRACRSRSTCRRTAATTATTRAWSATSAWPAWRSTRSTTCASCSTASRSTACRCR